MALSVDGGTPDAPGRTFLDARGTRIQVLHGGDGPPLVYLHGAGGAGEWSRVHARLAETYRVIAPTHPGFGDSAELPGLEAVDDFAFFYLALLDDLGVQQAIVMGHSVGGWIAAELATWDPRRVSRLILSAPAGLRRDGVQQPDLFAADAERSAQLTYFDPTKAPSGVPTPETMEKRLRDRATLARVGWNPYLHNPRLAGRLFRVTSPTLLIWGANDRLIPPQIGEVWAEKLPDARLRLIPSCGHSINREQPDAVADLVGDFLGE